MITHIIMLIVLFGIGCIVGAKGMELRMQNSCRDEHKVYTCSMQPDHSAFTPKRGVQM